MMSMKRSFLSSNVHALSMGCICGLLLLPLGNLVFRSLALFYRYKRKPSLSPCVPSPLLRTNRGLIIHATPHPLVVDVGCSQPTGSAQQDMLERTLPSSLSAAERVLARK